MSMLSSWLKGSSKTKSAATTTHDPWAPTVAPLTDYLHATTDLYNGGAPQISPYEQHGYDLLSQVTGASPNMDAALAENTKTASGQYLTPETNPYLADIASRISGLALSKVNSTFGGKGRTGSGLHAELAGQGVGNSLTDLYGTEYEAERARQSQAVGQAANLEQGRYLAPQAAISAGQNISARPFDINAQYGGILGNLAQLGGTTNSSGTTTSTDGNKSLLGRIGNSYTNKLFPGA